jgi:hypothetical protein
MPISAPAIEGPKTRVPFMLICCSTMALDRRSGPTSSPVKAIRAGPRKEKPMPCRTAAAISIQYVMTSATTASARSAELIPSTSWHAISTLRFGRRSATTPPQGVSSSMGTPKPRNTAPSPLFVPVSS